MKKFACLVLSATALIFGCNAESTSDSPPQQEQDSGTDTQESTITVCSTVEILPSTCVALSDHFTQSTTLAKGCYRANTSPTLDEGVSLTLQPGVTILFSEGTKMEIAGNRTLIAEGTTQNPICLSSEKAARGSWIGLDFENNDNPSKLAYVTIEYAGNTTTDPTRGAVQALADSGGVTLEMSNTTIRDSEGYGLRIGASTHLPAFSGNTFTKNKLGPVLADSEVVGLLDAASRYTGNDKDEITVPSESLSKNATWKSLGVPYHLIGTLGLSVETHWTLEAPNTVIMPAAVGISVSGDDAALTAVGTKDNPIVFTAESKTKGYWDVIVFDNSMNTNNKFDYVTVEYAGDTSSVADQAAVRASADEHGVTLSITNSTLRESNGYGLYLAGTAVLPNFGNNTFTQNTLGPVNVGFEAVAQLETSSTYTGNDVDQIRVREGNVAESTSWADLGAPYHLESSVHVLKVWTLNPGVTLLMAKDTWISVEGDDAGLHAVGTDTQPITISGVEKTAGYWHAILFDGSINPDNTLEYVTVEYGGSPTGGGEEGMITAASDSHGVSLQVKHCTIKDSGQWGIWLGKFAEVNSDIETINTFSNDAKGNVYRQP